MSRHYTYRAEWSAEDNEYVGLVAEFPSLSWLADTAAEAIAGVARLVDDVLDDMETTGETPPIPFSERRYSGNIALRTSADQHRRLAIEAAEQGVSLNQWVNYRLSGPAARPARPDPLHNDEVTEAARAVASLTADRIAEWTARVVASMTAERDALVHSTKQNCDRVPGVRAVSVPLPGAGSFGVLVVSDGTVYAADWPRTGSADDDWGSDSPMRIAFGNLNLAEHFSPNG